MNKSELQKPVTEAFLDLWNLLESAKVSLTVLPIIQLHDDAILPDQIARLSEALGKLSSKSRAALERSETGMQKGLIGPLPRIGLFRYDGRDTWEIGLGKHVAGYKNVVGLHQMQLLLRRPNQRVSVKELGEVCSQKMVVNQSCPQEIIDAKALRQCQQRVETLKDELEIAKNTGNLDAVGPVEDEIVELERHLEKVRPFRGNQRRLDDQGNRLRDRVRFTLRSSTRQIIARDPDLGEHLQASIKLGFECGYFPLTKVNWAFDCN